MGRATCALALCAGALLFGSVSTLAHAQTHDEKYPWEEYEKRLASGKNVAALKSDLFGDSVNLQDGALSFSVTDVSIPGNSGLPVAFTRSYKVFNRKDYHFSQGMLADWMVDLPHITGNYVDQWLDSSGGGNRCSDTGGPPRVPPADRVFEIWHGLQMNLPGGGGGELLVTNPGTARPTDGKTYPWMTEGQAHVSCLPSVDNGTGEGFLAVTPDGTRYWFTWLAQYNLPKIEDIEYVPGAQFLSHLIDPHKNVLLVTRIRDRFGNEVNYSYSNAWNQPARLTQIQASDGRSITIDYTGDRISRVTAGNRQWNYTYGSTALGRGTLTAVIRPDGSSWSINFAGFTDGEIHYPEIFPTGEIMRDCTGWMVDLEQFRLNYDHPTEAIGTVTHPSGAVGTFAVEIQKHGRSHVPLNCSNVGDDDPVWGNNPHDDTNLFVISYETWTTTSKQITGPGLDNLVWNYSYLPNISWTLAGNATRQHPVCTPLGSAQCRQRFVCNGGPVRAPALPWSTARTVNGSAMPSATASNTTKASCCASIAAVAVRWRRWSTATT